ncbi:uncharacterized protein BJ171DRAFT_53948 [Polychytrium aggregatum]|uniref:uncharacterized protein n=1 Tax=Polychytrium aggregatum TaxID=110093 RepID=UPI0022FE66A8|nr:uncharacterized protein BJ171DRAFT_53948 [Polychytrium aggregatum]KAI9205845.1 hypothetical protein BJ171DRAFT_53948 [Polychytrium aggregatum]
MVKSLQSRVSYSIPGPGPLNAHSRGINALALDLTTPVSPTFSNPASGILYTAGRDGLIHAWDLNIDFKASEANLRERERAMQQRSMRTSISTSKSNLNHRASVSSKRSSVLQPRHLHDNVDHTLFYSPELMPENADRIDDASVPPLDISGIASEAGFHLHPSSHRAQPLAINTSPAARLNHGSLYDSPQTGLEKRTASGSYDDQWSFRTHGGLLRKTRSVTFTDPSLPMARTMSKSGSSAAVEKMALSPKFEMYVPPAATHRQVFQHHSDWVNDIVLCNDNQQLISASNDRLIYLRSCHSSGDPVRIGFHADAVKRLAYPRERNWIVSGGLDHCVVLWDLNEARGAINSIAVNTFRHISKETNPQSSVYALATNPSGSVIVSGAPDKIVRVWDPRTNGNNPLALPGHTDNIRDILVSDDGRWVLSASSDTTIKLWSLAAPHRCVVTYTHHTESVWALASNHPNLETFWAGSRDGLVTKFNRRRLGAGGPEEELVDCVAVCKENGPVSKIAAIDDMYLWTATPQSSVNRWRDIPLHVATVEVSSPTTHEDHPEVIIIPPSSIIHQHPVIFNDAASWDTRLRSAYSTDDGASFRTGLAGTFAPSGMVGLDENDSAESLIEPVWRMPDSTIQGKPYFTDAVLLNSRRHAVTKNSAGDVCLWDILTCQMIKQLGQMDLKEAIERENTIEWIPSWCAVDIKNDCLTVHLDESRCFDAELYDDQVDIPSVPGDEDHRVNLGKWILTNLFLSYVKEHHRPHPAIPTPLAQPLQPTGGLAPSPQAGAACNTASVSPPPSTKLLAPATPSTRVSTDSNASDLSSGGEEPVRQPKRTPLTLNVSTQPLNPDGDKASISNPTTPTGARPGKNKLSDTSGNVSDASDSSVSTTDKLKRKVSNLAQSLTRKATSSSASSLDEVGDSGEESSLSQKIKFRIRSRTASSGRVKKGSGLATQKEAGPAHLGLTKESSQSTDTRSTPKPLEEKLPSPVPEESSPTSKTTPQTDPPPSSQTQSQPPAGGPSQTTDASDAGSRRRSEDEPKSQAQPSAQAQFQHDRALRRSIDSNIPSARSTPRSTSLTEPVRSSSRGRVPSITHEQVGLPPPDNVESRSQGCVRTQWVRLVAAGHRSNTH